MRGSTKIAMVGVFGLLSVGLVVGQPPGGFQPGGFGGPSSDPYSLTKDKRVQEDLKITEEQLEKLPEAVQKALKEVLTAKQMQRLEQISLQRKGVNAFKDPDVQKKLNMSSAQKEDINALFAESQKGAGKGGKGFFQRQQELQKQINSVLSESQRDAFEEMLGERIKFGGFGGPGGGPGKKPQKDDT